jgi:2-furoate---CoA ligase
MLDLGTSFIATVAREPKALAIVDGNIRLNYTEWYQRISSVVGGLQKLGLKQGDHLVTALQNRWEAATLHWACQFSGIIITPVNWRAKFDEIDFFIENSDAKAIVYENVSSPMPYCSLRVLATVGEFPSMFLTPQISALKAS